MEDSMQMADLNSMKRVCPNIQNYIKYGSRYSNSTERVCLGIRFSSIPIDPSFDLFVI